MSTRTYRHFGLAADPWPAHTDTADTRRMALAISDALATGGLLAIAAPRGSGKTHGLWRALAECEATVIEPLRLDRDKLHIGDIQRAIVTTLSDERPRHSGEARAGQVRRLIRATEPRPVLVIDEAHHLHHATLRALKRLRELGARGRRTALLPVILVGQADPTARIAELALRADALTLTGLAQAEVKTTLKRVLGQVAEAEAITAIAAASRGGNWLELHRDVGRCLAAAMADGKRRLSRAVVTRTLGGARQAKAAAAATPAAGEVAALLGEADQGRRAAR